MISRIAMSWLVGSLCLYTGSSCAQRASSIAPPSPTPTPTPGWTTIAPFPVPGDTSAEDALRRKMLNLPRVGDYVYVDELPEATIGPAHAALPRASSASSSNIATAAPTVHDTDCAEYDTEVMPDVLHREAPVHPDAARAAGIQGTVMLFARVLEDSTVGEVRVVRSIPALDSAAVACVRRWRFKPGEHCRHAYPTWIGIPIKFALP